MTLPPALDGYAPIDLRFQAHVFGPSGPQPTNVTWMTLLPGSAAPALATAASGGNARSRPLQAAPPHAHREPTPEERLRQIVLQDAGALWQLERMGLLSLLGQESR